MVRTQRTEQDWNIEKRTKIGTQRTKQTDTWRTEQVQINMEHGELYKSGEHREQREQNNPEHGKQNKSRAIWNMENR